MRNSGRDRIYFSKYGILSGGRRTGFPDTEWRWAVDPLDGTTTLLGNLIWGGLGLLNAELRFRGLPPLISLFNGECTDLAGGGLDNMPLLRF